MNAKLLCVVVVLASLLVLSVSASGSVPHAAFTSDVVTGYSPLTVQFNDTSSGTPTSWLWSFGDGTPRSTLQNPSHVYTKSGKFVVALYVRNCVGGDSELKSKYIVVKSQPPVPNFTYGRYGTGRTQFFDNSTGDLSTVTSRSWKYMPYPDGVKWISFSREADPYLAANPIKMLGHGSYLVRYTLGTSTGSFSVMKIVGV